MGIETKSGLELFVWYMNLEAPYGNWNSELQKMQNIEVYLEAPYGNWNTISVSDMTLELIFRSSLWELKLSYINVHLFSFTNLEAPYGNWNTLLLDIQLIYQEI